MFGSALPATPAPASSGFALALRQRTLKTAVTVRGVGLHSGAQVTLTLRPGQPGQGVVFRRTDLTGTAALVPARWDAVSDTRLNTCVSNAHRTAIHTIEHLMAALAGLQVDNAVIDIDGPEVPVMDGSAQPFLYAIEAAGVAEQAAPRRFLEVLKPVEVRDGDKIASLTPAPGFTLHCEIAFASAAIGSQGFAIALGNDAFRTEIARARTFGFEHEVNALRSMGLARGGSLENAVVISGDRVLNPEGLRFDDEFVRHKLLDAVGDLYLAGGPLLGHFHGVRSGHALNNRLLHALFADDSAYAWTSLDQHPAVSVPRVAAE